MTVSNTTAAVGPEAGAQVLRPHAEDAFADELKALAAADDRPRPPVGGCRRGPSPPICRAEPCPTGR